MANAVSSDPGDTEWPQSCSAPGFLGNCDESSLFAYSVAGTPGDLLRIVALGKDGTPATRLKMTLEITKLNS